MRKKVYLIAYTSLNFGDDLFIRIICQRYPKVQFYLGVTGEISSPFDTIENLKVIKIPILFKAIDYLLKRVSIQLSFTERYMRKYILKCDAIVHIGGSIFMQHSNSKLWKWEMNTNLSRTQYNIPIFVMGSNFGPFTDETFFSEYKKVFAKFNDICFRESHSFQLFQELNNVRKAPDIVFNLPEDKYVENGKGLEKKIVISVIDLNHKEKIHLKKHIDVYESHILEAAKLFSDKGYEVVFVGFCINQQDDQAIDRITHKLDSEKYNFKVINYSGDIEQILSVYQSADLIISSRFHSMILALVLNKNNFSLVYSDKISNVMNDLGLNKSYCHIQNLSIVAVTDIEENSEKLTLADLKHVTEEADKQFLGFDNWLHSMDGGND